MSYLEIPEVVEPESYLGNNEEDNDETQAGIADYVSPFSTDEHHLEEPTSFRDGAASTQESTDQFQRSWRIDRHAGDSYVYGMNILL
jgi:hypothetical protein